MLLLQAAAPGSTRQLKEVPFQRPAKSLAGVCPVCRSSIFSAVLFARLFAPISASASLPFHSRLVHSQSGFCLPFISLLAASQRLVGLPLPRQQQHFVKREARPRATPKDFLDSALQPVAPRPYTLFCTPNPKPSSWLPKWKSISMVRTNLSKRLVSSTRLNLNPFPPHRFCLQQFLSNYCVQRSLKSRELQRPTRSKRPIARYFTDGRRTPHLFKCRLTNSGRAEIPPRQGPRGAARRVRGQVQRGQQSLRNPQR